MSHDGELVARRDRVVFICVSSLTLDKRDTRFMLPLSNEARDRHTRGVRESRVQTAHDASIDPATRQDSPIHSSAREIGFTSSASTARTGSSLGVAADILDERPTLG